MRIFSGVQPTGEIHIGNYLGALKQWIELQKTNECIYCIVDLHALTSDYDPDTLKSSVIDKAIAYLAAGIDPEKTTIFIQSEVKEHSELCWYLNSVTPIGELERMTQYKEKSAGKKKSANAGLLNYPILMAADILLYDTEIVPVGEDQIQHVELARDIGRKFNNRFGETFTIPESQLPKQGARIMSLKDPEIKMSKSGKAGNAISLFDTPDQIKQKIKTATTDTDDKIKYDVKEKPGISNLLVIYSEFSNQKIEDSEKDFESKSYKQFKEKLTDLLVESLLPFREKQNELELRKEIYVREVLNQGKRKAEKLAEAKITEVKRAMGL